MDIAIETVVEIIFWLITIGVILLIVRNSMIMKKRNELYLIRELRSNDNQE